MIFLSYVHKFDTRIRFVDIKSNTILTVHRQMESLHRGHDLLQRTWSAEAVAGWDDYPQATKPQFECHEWRIWSITRAEILGQQSVVKWYDYTRADKPQSDRIQRTWSTEVVMGCDDYIPSPAVSPVSPGSTKRVSFDDKIKQRCFIVNSHMKPFKKTTMKSREVRKAAREVRKAAREEAWKEAWKAKLIRPTQI
jgi:hypothetical protein